MAELQTKRHPIRGALYGLILGLSIWYFLQFEFATFTLDSVGGVLTRLVIVVVATMAVGVLWAYIAPARKPKDSAPTAPRMEEPPPAPGRQETAPEGNTPQPGA